MLLAAEDRKSLESKDTGLKSAASAGEIAAAQLEEAAAKAGGAELEPAAPTTPETSEEVLPRRFGRFTLLRQVARGGMGELYLASTIGIEGAERPCVLKIVRKDHADDRSFRARFLDEARIQAQFQHPGIAQILEAATDETGCPYVVLEHIEGRNIAEARNRLTHLDLRISWPDAVAIGVSLGDALAHVHERADASGKPLEIAHRDLSPQNVMLSYHGDLKLIDFGTARGENRRSKTIKGVVFAKPGYVAPEVVNQEPGGAPADLYAFGIILWEILAGRRFLSGEPSTHMAQVGAGRRNPPGLAHSLRIPRALDTIIARLTAPRIQDRYASARQATADLVEVLSTAPSPTGSDRSVRGRIATLMQRLYPGEPARSRQDFVSLVAQAKSLAIAPAAPLAKPREALTPPKKPASDVLPGTRYQLVRELGRGGMGVVHEARHIDLGRKVALKILPKDSGKSSQDTLRTEAQTIAGLRHKNLVRLYDFGISEDGRAYYAMELLDGESLESKLRRERGMDYREALGLAIQACDALGAAHSAGVVHRDIKPANLFVTANGDLKLLDFGIAKVESKVEPRDEHEGSALSITGTPEYISPEQARGRSADARSDIYALGVVLYELLTGRLPHDGSTTVALLDAKIRRAAKSPRECAPERGLPKQLDEIVQRALETVPALRFQSALEFRTALARALQQGRPEARRSRLRWMTAGSAGALSVGLTLAALSHPGVVSRAKDRLAPALHLLQRFGVESAAAPSSALNSPAAATDAVLTETVAAGQVLEPQAAEADPMLDGEDDGVEGDAVDPAAAGKVVFDPNTNSLVPSASGVAASAHNNDAAENAAESDSAADNSANDGADDDPGVNDGADDAIDLDAVADNDTGDDSADNTADGAADTDPQAGDPGADAPADAQRAAPESPSDKPQKPDRVAASLRQAEALVASGRKLKAFYTLKRAGLSNYGDPRVLEAWSKAAAETKTWGEALRVARRWAQVDPRPEALLHLATLLRSTGHRRESIGTLYRLLRAHPECTAAEEMLAHLYGRQPKVALADAP